MDRPGAKQEGSATKALWNIHDKVTRYERIQRMWGEDPYEAACVISEASHFTSDGITEIDVTFSEFLISRLRHAEDEIAELEERYEWLLGETGGTAPR